jgi:glycosyltransferase involved in cell wall biosynthesis
MKRSEQTARPLPLPKSSRPWITCVVPAYNEAEGITEFINTLCTYLSGLTEKYDVIVVDDGSRDETALKIISASGGLPVKLLTLSRNFGKEAAISAGLDQAHGEVVVIIDADFQHPIDLIGEFISHWQQGYDMVYGVRTHRDADSPLRRNLSRMFYSLLSRGASVDIPADAGDFRLLDQRVVEALRLLPETGKFMKGLYSWVGFNKVAIPFECGARMTGKSKFNLPKLFDLAMTGLTSFSSFPLRMWVGVGFFISSAAIIYAIYILVRTVVSGTDLPGWATLVVAVTFLGGVQLLSVGLLGEYVARIFNEVKRRPGYLIAERHGFNDEHQG